jgi:hypothetical protein
MQLSAEQRAEALAHLRNEALALDMFESAQRH